MFKSGSEKIAHTKRRLLEAERDLFDLKNTHRLKESSFFRRKTLDDLLKSKGYSETDINSMLDTSTGESAETLKLMDIGFIVKYLSANGENYVGFR